MTENRLETKNITIGYESDLIREISLSLTAGRIVTLIGPNGCGKTTLLKTVCGLLREREGVICLNGQDIHAMRSKEAARELSIVTTASVRPERMTCREIIETGRYPYTGVMGILDDTDKAAVIKAIEMTDTAEVADREFGMISDGQKQRVLLARAICQEPKVLILDEPTSYLDIRYKLDILNRIRKLAKEENMAVLLSLHELEIARELSDTVVAIGNGKIRKIGTPKEVFTESFIRELFGIKEKEADLLGQKPWMGTDPSAGVKDPVRKHGGSHTDSLLISEENMGAEQTSGVRVLMVQGTMSNAGKSLLSAGLCRIFTQDGYRVAPFKAQNMALNSYITADGLEMGRAQVVQAECCKREPQSCMNPVLLKPFSDRGSQVIVNGKVVGNMNAAEYFAYKKELIPEIKNAFDTLAQTSDLIVVEGAGSPVELNLLDNDIVNMGLAKLLNAKVILAGDIDRGGIFAQLIGTLDLFGEEDRDRVIGLIVNKFRGDQALFEKGRTILAEKSGKKVLGVVPYLDIHIDDEDSLTDQFHNRTVAPFDIAVIRLPHISNFTDFNVFSQLSGVSVRYVTSVETLEDPDIVIIPGSKNTIGDLQWLKGNGFVEAIRNLQKENRVIFGICGGYQMLGRKISDPFETEGPGKCEETGLALLPVDTVLEQEKTRTVFSGSIENASGVLSGLCGLNVEGYEIHMGKTTPYDGADPFTDHGTGYCSGNVYGTYIHGFFDRKEILTGFIRAVCAQRGKTIDTGSVQDMRDFKEQQYDLLASELRKHLDIGAIYDMLGIKRRASKISRFEEAVQSCDPDADQNAGNADQITGNAGEDIR
ncbi:MAG: cobyric acid synthase [Lachnospiraceae bacterium]|nr:cobyric acid synthase [Lachnospiraceae bacterium]